MKRRRQFSRARADHWDRLAGAERRYQGFSRAYHERLRQIYRLNIPRGSRVLEVGCGKGDLLAALEPEHGVGIDFSQRMIEEAKSRHPGLEFQCLDAHDAGELNQRFDYIILSDLLNDVFDVEEVLRQVSELCHAESRVLINFYSHLWAGILKTGQLLNCANPLLPQNWLARADLKNLFTLTDFEWISGREEIILPLRIPWLTGFVNRVFPKIWPLSHLSLTHFVVARHKKPADQVKLADAGVSVVVAARNEAGHIERLIDEIPLMGRETEVIFVEGGSRDDTYDVIHDNLARRSDLSMSLYRQPGAGKADAVRMGFDQAKHDILMILDADISVAPHDLQRFHAAIVSGRGELINGVRLVYPMGDKAMRFLNLLGNKFFCYAFRFALGQPIKDTLCGTKVVSRSNYNKIARTREYFGDVDPYGDFDLIFGAAKLNLKILDLPIRYQPRTYGQTNINRWSGGALLLKMVLIGLRKIKFV